MAHEIISGLYIGNKDDATQDIWDFIVNCTPDIPISKKYINKSIRLDLVDFDGDNDNMIKLLPYTTEIINNKLKNNKKVLVHCTQGISRSASIVVGYLMRYCNLSYIDAVILVESKRKTMPKVLYRNVFNSALEKWNNQINNLN